MNVIVRQLIFEVKIFEDFMDIYKTMKIFICLSLYFCSLVASHVHIKTHDSESRGQEEAAVRDE